MNQVRIYRSLVVVSALLYVTWYFLADYQTSADPSVAKLLSLDGYAATIYPQSWVPTTGVFWLWLLVSVGLIFYQNWGRHLYLSLTIWSLVSAGLYGVRVSSPLDSALGLVIDLLDGAILAMIYLSPTKDMFGCKTKPPGIGLDS